MLARLFSFVVWALVAATAVFWGLRLLSRSPVTPSNAVVASEAATTRGDLTRLLGAVAAPAAAQAAPPEAGARFRLLGIMAPRSGTPRASGSGVALIAVDGKLPRAYTVGAAVDGDWVLQSVSLRTADIGPQSGVAALRLELPVLPAAATGTLQPVTLPGPVVRFNPAAVQPQRAMGNGAIPPGMPVPPGGRDADLPPTAPPALQSGAAPRD